MVGIDLGTIGNVSDYKPDEIVGQFWDYMSDDTGRGVDVCPGRA
jgi:hypothetical protein